MPKMRYSSMDEYRRKQCQIWGDKFSEAALAPQFVPYFLNGRRVRVTTNYPEVEPWTRTGTVGVTGGWQPIFLLMRRSSQIGSSDTLNASDLIVAVQDKPGGAYREVQS